MNKKKKMFLIISIISIVLILLVGGTLAFFGWTSDKEALVNVTVSSGSGSCSLINDNNIEVFPTYSKHHGRKIKLYAKQEMAEKAYITWTMVVNEINSLQDKTFKYELINVTTGVSYGSGDFENITAEEGTNTITFSNNEEVLGYNRDYKFVLYLWIDGTIGDNPISMADQTFDFDMNCSITGTDNGVVAEPGVLMIVEGTQNATSNFLRSSITREKISSVTFVDPDEVPSTATTQVDVSKNEDGTVNMWYGTANSSGLYDIYITGKNGDVIIEDGTRLFTYLTSATEIDIANTNTSFLTSMFAMFKDCPSLLTINFGDIDTSEVTSMATAFYRSSAFTTLDLSSFDTSNVTEMQGMFQGCSSLTDLNVSHFNTGKVTDMRQVFLGCYLLKELDLSKWDMSNVTTVYLMFSQPTADNSPNMELISIGNVSRWDTSNIENFGGMFQGCRELKYLDLSGWNTSSATTMQSMFWSCNSLRGLNINNFDTSNVTNMASMFYNCSSLTALNVSGFKTANVTNMNSMFGGCSSLTTLSVGNWNTASVTDMASMFGGCSSLTTLDVSNWNVSKVSNMSNMFAGCEKLTVLDVSRWNTLNVKNMSSLFNSCKSVLELDLSKWVTNKVTDMSWMIYHCDSLTSVDLSSFDTSKVTDMSGMFAWSKVLKTIYVGDKWDTSSVTSAYLPFDGCFALVGGAGTKFNGNPNQDSKEITYARIDGGTENPGYFTSKA